jgi:hypothetical protein
MGAVRISGFVLFEIALALQIFRIFRGFGDGDKIDAAVGADDPRRSVNEFDVSGRGFQLVRCDLLDLYRQILAGASGGDTAKRD